jgi:hypothetical protein
MASCWKNPWKVVPSDEPTVPLRKRRIIRSLTSFNIAIEPTNTDNTPTIIRCTVGLSGAEGPPLGASLYDSNRGVGWTAGDLLKCRFIRCWRRNLDASLYDLNEGITWTICLSVGSSGAEETEAQTLLLPNPRASDELMLVPSVHSTVTFEFSSRRTHWRE